MKKLILLFLVVFVTAFAVRSQNTNGPWLIGISTNYADFHAVKMTLNEQLTDANWMGKTLPTQLKVGRSLNSSFNLSGEFSWIKLEIVELNQFLSIYHESETFNPITNSDMYRYNAQLEYKFANGYLLKENAHFDPYIFVGMNGASINDLTYLGQTTGVGFNLWISDMFGVNAEGSYDYLFEYNDYFHYSFGLVFRVGKLNDMDKDGIPDKNDACPDVFGLKEFAGCPDSDGDGIIDKEDKCPTVAGPKETFGCPDKDGDGILDKDDRCPDVAGLASLKGCPDKDNDGVADIDDRCPDVAGLATLKGCPDEDKDGVADIDDKCPGTAAGIKVDATGCAGDNDKDGVPNDVDECPDQAGIAALKGCPDTDGDGVADHLDRCPTLKGTIENKGCPEIAKEDVKKITQIASKIYFEFNSAQLTKTSTPQLDALIVILNKYEAANLSIEGHTDNVGSDDYNLELSQKRAESVKAYLSSKGIIESRLTAKGFGETKPVASNDTKEGQAQNRRVELKTSY